MNAAEEEFLAQINREGSMSQKPTRWEGQRVPSVVHVNGQWYTTWGQHTMSLDMSLGLSGELRPVRKSVLCIDGAIIAKGGVVSICMGRRYPKVMHFFMEGSMSKDKEQGFQWAIEPNGLDYATMDNRCPKCGSSNVQLYATVHENGKVKHREWQCLRCRNHWSTQP